MAAELPLIVIVGPTASGKTAAAIRLAKKYNGEIICADSRTVYRGMDIGTAKPTEEEQSQVPHWGLNLVSPNERFTAAQFKEYAEAKIGEIRARNHVPFLVGGTGLYVDSILFQYEFGQQVDHDRRAKLEHMSLEQLWGYCKKNNIILPENMHNKRYVIRAIEQKSINGKRKSSLIENSAVVGIATNKRLLKDRIIRRAEQLFQDSVVEEATILGKKYGWDHESMTGNIYPIVHSYLENEITLEQAIDLFTTSDVHLAKRQMTWFRRNPWIEWLDFTEVEDYIHLLLAPEHIS